ncbi:MAG: hypothetical protein ACYDCQ_01130 [Dehalococcoidia bacterium]
MQQGNVIEQPRPADEGVAEEPGCRHHWRIESPNGATSMGRCKVCGENREFMNSSSDSIWENDSDSGNRWRGRGRGSAPVADVPASNAAPAPISESALGRLLGTGYRGHIE